jgi:DNA mismatch repair protein MutS2
VQDLRHLDWNEVLKHLQNSATSGTARLKLAQLQSLPDQESAQQSLRDIFNAMEILAQGTRPFMEALDLFEPWHGRLKRKAVLKNLEIKDVRSFCFECVALDEVLRATNNSWATNVRAQLMNASEPLSAIDQILTPRGDIRSDSSETLYRLFREKEGLARQIETTLDKLVKDNDMQSYLQDRYVTTREGRWVLPIRSGNQHSVDGVIHGSSQTKQTVFMEPGQVIPINNRLRQVEVEIEDEIERLLTQLSEYLSQHVQDFAQTRDLLEQADCLFAKAQWSIQIEGKPFEFSESEILLVDAKHPLMHISAKKPVPNTIHLSSEKSILLLSGPNAGGKTVLLKSVGLASQMARCGLPLCASEGSRIPFFKNIHIGLGDSQSVDEELSTFAAHVKVLQAGLALHGLDNLILIDEICGSTDPEEGAALARSFIESYARNNCFAVITSHLGPLKSGWKETSRVMSGSLEYDTKSGRPTYQFLPGVPGDSLAIQTAKRVGVSHDIITRATELLSPTTRSRLAGLEEIEQLKNDIHTLRDQLKKDTAKAKFEQDKYTNLTKKFEQEKEQLLHKAVREAEKKIEDLISQTKAEQTFKKHMALQEIKTELPEIVKIRTGQGSSPTTLNSAEDFGKKFPAGSKVYVPSLQQDAIVQSSPNGKGEVMVLSNSMRLTLPWQDLKSPQVSQNPTATLVRRTSNVSIALQDQEKTMDLRGLTVDEALSRLEMELDQAATRREDRIKIIHGHGTEALKKAVRTHLSRSMFVKKWKAGSPEQGGDGVTWAELGSGE